MEEHDTVNTCAERKTDASVPFGLFNIELTNRCPMKCVMCPRTGHMTREQGFMDINLFKKIIDELAGVNESFHRNKVVWLHHFGESLLHPQFDLFIRYALEKGIYTGLSVNPVMLDEKKSHALLESGLHVLYLSLDGHDDESFFKIRGVNNIYETSRSNTINFLKLKKEKPCDMRIILSMIDFSLNKESVAAVENEWRSHPGIDEFLLKTYTTWDGNVPEIHALAPDAPVNRPQGSKRVTCSFPWINMTVTWDGDVVPCCYDYNKKFVLGSAVSRTLTEIWNGPPMQNLRNEFMTGVVTNPLCVNCSSLRS